MTAMLFLIVPMVPAVLMLQGVQTVLIVPAAPAALTTPVV
jgi:hypothetical protein